MACFCCTLRPGETIQMGDGIQPERASAVAAQQAPISWLTERGTVKLRPKGLKLVTVLLCADLVLPFGYNNPALWNWNSTTELLTRLLGKVFWLWVFWLLWKGRNWARILTMISAGSISLIPFYLPGYMQTGPFYVVVSSNFYAYLMYWLNTKSLVRFFKAPGNGVSNPPPSL